MHVQLPKVSARMHVQPLAAWRIDDGAREDALVFASARHEMAERLIDDGICCNSHVEIEEDHVQLHRSSQNCRQWMAYTKKQGSGWCERLPDSSNRMIITIIAASCSAAEARV